MPSPSLLQRLKERKLVQWALAYLAAVVVVVGVLEAVGDAWQLPRHVEQGIHILLITGLFVTLVLAWFHGEKGQQRVSGSELLMLVGLFVVGGVALTTLIREDRRAPAGSGTPVDDPRPRIAVLPFRDQSRDTADAYFAVVVQGRLTTGLTHIPSLAVIPQFSVERYRDPANRPPVPQIADALGADYLLDGGAGIIGQAVRITVNLVEGAAGVSRWSDVFDVPWEPEDYFRVESEIVQRIASALRAEISRNMRLLISDLSVSLAGSTSGPAES